MNKVICDVCGTSFPETSEQCPICGCAKLPTAQTVSVEDSQAAAEGTTAYNYVKGGRFSKANVKNGGSARTVEQRPAQPERRRSRQPEANNQNEAPESNKGLFIVVAILLLAIVIVVVFIGVQIFMSNDNAATEPSGSTAPSTQESLPSNETIACTEIRLQTMTKEFTATNEQLLIPFEIIPANTTDQVTFVSQDPAVAIVDANGLVQPVGYGQTQIEIKCGTQTAYFTVTCSFGEQSSPTEPSEPDTDLPAGFVLKLITYRDSGEITLSKDSKTHQLYKEIDGVKPSDITWTTSDPAIATVENGKVTGVDRGTATITATIGGQTATCKVHCNLDAEEPVPYNISHKDVTIAEGESFFLSLTDDATGAKIQDVTWTASKEGIVTIGDNGKITGGSVETLSRVDVSAEVDGHTYTCVIFVKAAPAAE